MTMKVRLVKFTSRREQTLHLQCFTSVRHTSYHGGQTNTNRNFPETQQFRFLNQIPVLK